jgi:hypothetical protein
MLHTALRFTALTLFSSALVYACSAAGPDQPLATGAAGTPGAGGDGSGASGAAGAGSAGTGSGAAGTGGSAGGAGGGSGGAGAEGPGAGSGGGTTLTRYPDAGFEYTPSDAGPETCAAVTGQATLRKKPMDIIIGIDNSGSMAGEIQAVQQRVNEDFASIIEASGIDYRVILVSHYGNVHDEDTSAPFDGAFGVCIGEPLGGSACPADQDDSMPALVNDRLRFFHDSINIGSGNMWCQLTSSFSQVTASAPSGWGAWLRPEAFKVFIGITDDSPRLNFGGTNGQCATSTGLSDNLAGAQQFDTLLRGLSAQFGTSDARNYAWYSIVGMAGNDASNPTPLQPSEAVESSCCRGDGSSVTCPASDSTPDADGVRAGTGYQELSRMTGGLRYPSCFNSNFDAMFNAVAQGVIERSSASCEYALPDPEGATINPANIVATYHPSGVGQADVALSRVTAENQCSSTQGFYLDDNESPTRLFLCPEACSVVQADDDARIDIDFGCLGS